MPTYGNYDAATSEYTYAAYGMQTNTEECKAQNSNAILSPKTTVSAAQIKKEHLEKIFGEIFSEYNYVCYDVLATLSKIMCETDFEKRLENINEIEINNLIEVVKKAFSENYDERTQTLNVDNATEKAKQYHLAGGVDAFNDKTNVQTIDEILKSDKDSGLSNEKKILNYFENKLEEYNVEFKDINKAKNELKKDFYRILAQTSDADKKLLLPVLLTVLNDVKAVENFFSSYDKKNIKLKTECADSVDRNILKSLSATSIEDVNYDVNTAIATEITKNMSAEELVKYLNETKADFKNYYSQHEAIIKTILEKIKNGTPLNEDEEVVRQELGKFNAQLNVLLVGSVQNKNFPNDDAKQKFIKDIVDVQKEYPTYELYLESLAQFVQDNKISLNLAEDTLEQLKNYLDNATDGKYSETVNILAEKNSAYDSEKGGFKTTATPVEVAQKQQALIEQRQQLVVEEEPQEFTVEPSGHNNSQIVGNDSEQSIITAHNYTPDSIIDIFTGKVDAAEYVKQMALKDYKLLGISDKGDILMNATSGFFNRLLEATKDSTLVELLDRGLRARTFAQTTAMHEKVEEDKNNGAA